MTIPDVASWGVESFEEELDRDDLPLAETHRALRDLARVNRFLFGHQALRLSLRPLFRESAGGRLRLLDVAAGTADSTPELKRAAQACGFDLSVVASDRKLSHLVLGRALGTIEQAVVADAEHLPFRPASVDWVVSSLFLHHLEGDSMACAVAEMRAAASRAVVVVDLRRSLWAEWALAFLGRLLGLGGIALRDGRRSLRRTLSIGEWRGLSRHVGGSLRRRFPARVAVVVPAADTHRGGFATPVEACADPHVESHVEAH